MKTLTSSLIVRLIDRASRPARGIANSLMGIRRAGESVGQATFGDRLTAGIRRNDAALARARGGLIDAAAGFYALKTAIGAPVREAMLFESAMADVRKVVDFPTPESFENFRKGLVALSKQVPVSVNGLAAIAAAAGQAGIAGDDLNRFTEHAAKIGVAFDISAAEAGESMAKMMTGLKLSLDEATLLADAMNHLSNNQASSAREVLDVIRCVGAEGKQFGFAAQEVAALGSAMIASGAESNVAATSFRNMGNALTAGTSATKRVREGFEALGLDAAVVARRMQEDAVATTVDVFERLSKMPKDVQAALSKDIFGKEARALGPLLTNLDLVRDSLGLVDDATRYAGSSFREFEVRAGTFENAVQIFSNRLSALKIVIGSALIPVINDLMEAISPAIDRMAAFADAHPVLISNALAAAGAFVAVKAALAGLTFAGLLGRGGALSLMAIGLGTVGKASKGLWGAAAANVAYNSSLKRMAGKGRLSGLEKLGAALRGMAWAIPGVGILGGVLKGLAVAATAVGGAIAGITAPVWGAIALGVAAVAAAGYALWKWWDRIAATLSGVARRLGEELQPALEYINPVLERIRPVTEAVGSAFDAMGSAIGRVIDWFRSKWTGFTSWIKGFFQREVLTEKEAAAVEKRGYDMADRVIKAIKKVFGALIDIGRTAIADLLAGMREKAKILIEWAEGLPGRISEAIETLPGLMIGAGRAAFQSLWDGAVETFDKFIEWVKNIPQRIVAAIGSIDLSNIINWPEPPRWWTYLVGGDNEQAHVQSAAAIQGAEQMDPVKLQAGQTLQDARSRGSLPTPRYLEERRERVRHLKEEIAGIQEELDQIADGPVKQIVAQPLEMNMASLKAELQTVETELANGEQQAKTLIEALVAIDDTETKPEISTRSIDEALRKLRLMADEMNRLRNAKSVPGPASRTIPVRIDGRRAGSGEVRAGETHLVGEEGEELVTFGQRGFVHNARATASILRNATARMVPGGNGPAFDGAAEMRAQIRQSTDYLRSTATAAIPFGNAASAPAAAGHPNSLPPQVNVTISSITINGVQDIRGAASEIRDMLEQELSREMRGIFADGMT